MKNKKWYLLFIAYLELQKIATAARRHWNIENTLHWSLDVTFKDDCRIRDEISDLNVAWFRKMALSFLKLILPFGNKINSTNKKMLYSN